jgi:hypothetical protein
VAKEGSLSILVPGSNKIQRKEAVGATHQELLAWFKCAENRAWHWVREIYKGDTPKTIFLVTGQCMSPTYSITHQYQNESVTRLELEIESRLPAIVDGRVSVVRGCKKLKPLTVFEKSQEPRMQDGEWVYYSLFLSIFESKPPRLLETSLGRYKKMLEFYK